MRVPALEREVVRLHVGGDPAPQGSLEASVIGGRAVIRQGGSKEGRRKLSDWRHAIASEARRWLAENGNPAPYDGPCELLLWFYLPRPTSLAKWRWLPWTGVDVDKLARASLDALSRVLYRDDSRVVTLAASKRYAIDCAPGCDIELRFLEERTT